MSKTNVDLNAGRKEVEEARKNQEESGAKANALFDQLRKEKLEEKKKSAPDNYVSYGVYDKVEGINSEIDKKYISETNRLKRDFRRQDIGKERIVKESRNRSVEEGTPLEGHFPEKEPAIKLAGDEFVKNENPLLRDLKANQKGLTVNPDAFSNKKGRQASPPSVASSNVFIEVGRGDVAKKYLEHVNAKNQVQNQGRII
jgi:hypothetical protein